MISLVFKGEKDMALLQPDVPQVQTHPIELSQHDQIRSGKFNVAPVDRFISGIGGGALIGYGIFRRDWPGAIIGALGLPLLMRAVTGHSYLYKALDINTVQYVEAQSRKPDLTQGDNIRIERAVTIERSPGELYRFWRNFENLPRFMDHLDSVTVHDNMHSHWVAKAPAGKHVEWDAVITNERENEALSWHSVGNSDIGNAGTVQFTPAPGGRGTVVKVTLQYDPPAGRLGATIAKLFGEEPDQQVREDLRHFKEIMEAGEIPTTQGQPAGSRK
jgi:uncharacterized membrane protein